MVSYVMEFTQQFYFEVSFGYDLVGLFKLFNLTHDLILVLTWIVSLCYKEQNQLL